MILPFAKFIWQQYQPISVTLISEKKKKEKGKKQVQALQKWLFSNYCFDEFRISYFRHQASPFFLGNSSCSLYLSFISFILTVSSLRFLGRLEFSSRVSLSSLPYLYIYDTELYIQLPLSFVSFPCTDSSTFVLSHTSSSHLIFLTSSSFVLSPQLLYQFVLSPLFSFVIPLSPFLIFILFPRHPFSSLYNTMTTNND